MIQNRREFLRLAGMGAFSGSLISTHPDCHASQHLIFEQPKSAPRQHLNMSGYAAPKIETVRIGFIGVGSRGARAVQRLKIIHGVEITGICDLDTDRAHDIVNGLKNSRHRPKVYSGNVDAWKEMCTSHDMDLIYICTPWEWHVPMSVFAMENEKHVGVEVPAATTIEGCWELVETSEKSRKHCMMLENTCYDTFELLTLNMAREGYFGEIIHGEGAYIHELNLFRSQAKTYKPTDFWRLEENLKRNGNLYPTHGIGPICQVMNINRGDQMDYLTSMSTDDFTLASQAKERAADDAYFSRFTNKTYRGNMNTSMIRTKKGKTIMVQHDVCSPRPYSRIHLISGTKGIARKYPEPGRIANGHEWLNQADIKALEQQYASAIVKKIGKIAKKTKDHGGMDFMMDWRFIDCLRNGLPLDQDVYDAALWSSIGPLSEWSVSNRSNSIDIPDFTSGSWETNKPVNLTLEGGGTTEVDII